jgi:hypothetical protein
MQRNNSSDGAAPGRERGTALAVPKSKLDARDERDAHPRCCLTKFEGDIAAVGWRGWDYKLAQSSCCLMRSARTTPKSPRLLLLRFSCPPASAGLATRGRLEALQPAPFHRPPLRDARARNNDVERAVAGEEEEVLAVVGSQPHLPRGAEGGQKMRRRRRRSRHVDDLH